MYALGTVRHIVYTDASPPAIPTCVVVQFDNYLGPSIDPEIESCVPIFPRKGLPGSKRSLPLKLAFALTIHKCQGRTFAGSVIIDLGLMDFASGQTFVALSRATRLSNMQVMPLAQERLDSICNAILICKKPYCSRFLG